MILLPEKIYVDIGTNEEPANPDNSRLDLEDAKRFRDALRKAGMPNDRLKFNIGPDATHTESAWAARFPDALKFLFPKPQN
jgi:predicted alpha/beta superfamily hydrolase